MQILNFCDDAALQDHNHPKPQVLISLLRVPVYCHQSPFLIFLQPHSMCTCEDVWLECRFLEILSFVQSCITNHSVSQALCFPSLSQRVLVELECCNKLVVLKRSSLSYGIFRIAVFNLRANYMGFSTFLGFYSIYNLSQMCILVSSKEVSQS